MIYTEKWYLDNVDDLFKKFNSSIRGLDDVSVQKNREVFGQNIIGNKKVENFFTIFLSQFKSSLIIVLIVASLIVIALGEYFDGGIIFTIVLLNAVIGTVQEGKSRKTLDALQKAVESFATVVRSGKTVVVRDTEVVVGDVLVLKDGSVIVADARLIDSNSFLVNQSLLTGESVSVEKRIVNLSKKDLLVADQINMVFKGTYVVSGLAHAIVVATGNDTAIGQIAEKLDEIHTEIPLQKNINNLSKIIVGVVLFLATLVFVLGVLQGEDTVSMFLVVVALSVSAIPESLPVVVTLVLAAGVFRMSKKNVLVKRLQAVEALGQASVLALDKTGTITSNEMQVVTLFTSRKTFEITGNGYEPVGNVLLDKNEIDHLSDKNIDLMTKISSLTSIAEISFDSEANSWKHILGDPTEAALKVFAEKLGSNKDNLETEWKKILEIPFNFHNKYHATIHKKDNKDYFFVSGSPEKILHASSSIYINGKTINLSEDEKEKIKSEMNSMASGGQRVIACAVDFNISSDYIDSDQDKLSELTFVGLLGVQDAIRPQVFDAIKRAQGAGIKIVIITGDYEATATSIATTVGIFKKGDYVISGLDIDKMSEREFEEKIEKATVFCRVSPQHKLKIIDMYKKKGEIIAMTGDGINDALSLTSADLGVAMGKMGTEVAREASDIILIDDNFDNVTSAVEEGRNMYSTIRKVILYLLSSNVGEMMVIVFAVFLTLPLPLLASQIIWLNMVTDTFLVAALAMEPKNKELIFRKPQKNSKWILDKLMLVRIFGVGLLMTVGTLILFVHFLPDGLEKAWTISLTCLTVFQWFNIFNVRSKIHSIFSSNPFKNKYLLPGLILAMVLHLFAIYTPFMQSVLHTTALNIKEWGIIILVALSVIVFEEMRKLFFKNKFI